MGDKGAALITGASAGLGKELAALAAADGYDVVLVARRRGRLDELAEELQRRHGVAALVLAEDLEDSGAPARIHRAVEQAGVHVEVLVNNAGFGSNGPFQAQDLPRELAMIQVNVAALVALTGLFLPEMLRRGSGRILNLGSTAGFQPGPHMATYYATKAFVNHWSEALAVELRGTGVTVTVSCPGPVATEFARVAGNDQTKLFKTWSVQPADQVAREAWRAMLRGRAMIVHGLAGKLGVQSLRLAPRALVARMAANLNRPALKG